MKTAERLDHIVGAVDEHGFMSVRDLSRVCQVSEVTIRRDLDQLHASHRIQRTYGGAASLRPKTPAPPSGNDADANAAAPKAPSVLADRFDVLITTSLDPKYDALLPGLSRKAVTVIAESVPVENARSCVAVNNYEASLALGRWAGQYAQEHFRGRACVLDLTYSLPNTQARSHGFVDGLREVLPSSQDVLSLNPLSRYESAYQLTRDALLANRDINIIFAINDTNAWGAINACRDMEIDPSAVVIIPFGLEGDTLKDALATGCYCQAGLAMFPEIVGRVLIEAAIAAYNHQPLPAQVITPFAVITHETLPEFYVKGPKGWALRWDTVQSTLIVPLSVDCGGSTHVGPVPQRIGFLVRFMEHDWYRGLIAAMHEQADCLGIALEVVDVDQTLREEVELRRREIARRAAQEVEIGDVVLIDGGPIAGYLAEELRRHRDITVVTNARRVFDILSDSPGITLISTGGALRRSTQVLVGPTTEATLGQLRVDTLFLMATGITLEFGLSHTDISEVTVKQAMIRSARRVILLADHTCFGHESMIQIAAPTVVHTLIADDALPASWRLELSKLGIEVVPVSM
ncbi:MAG: DeoR family transcriptional regulator [Anaerolineae bacterium]|nr:DeoR family transcriptional regulator [Anaerolineae bacterium]